MATNYNYKILKYQKVSFKIDQQIQTINKFKIYKKLILNLNKLKTSM